MEFMDMLKEWLDLRDEDNDPDEARAQIYWMIEKFYPDTNWDYELISGAMVTKSCP